MAEYIEREAVYTLAKKINDYIHSDEFHTATFGQIILDFVDDLPAADVKPVVRGKWLHTDAYPHHLYCSVCYKTYLPNDEIVEAYPMLPLNYCPNCGADMRGDNDDA